MAHGNIYRVSGRIYYNGGDNRVTYEIYSDSEDNAIRQAVKEYELETDQKVIEHTLSAERRYEAGGLLSPIQKRVYEQIKNSATKSMSTYNLDNEARKALDDLYYMDLLNRNYIKNTQEAEYTMKNVKNLATGGGVDYSDYEQNLFKKAIDFARNFVKEHPNHKQEVFELFQLMKAEIEEGSSVDREVESFMTACNDLIRKYAKGGGVGIEFFKKFENDFSSTRRGGVKNYSVDIDLENGEQLRGEDLEFKDGNDALFLYETIKKKGEYQSEKIEDIQLIANFKNGDYETIDIPQYALGGGIDTDYDPKWAEMEAYSPYLSRSEYEGMTEVEELQRAAKTFSKSAEVLVRENLKDGEICECKLKKILGREPNYPNQVVGSIKLEKAFLRPYYKLA